MKSVAALETSERPELVIGFAAETENVIEHAKAKRERKGCDWLLANDVSAGTGTFGGESNSIIFIDDQGHDTWPRMSKQEVGVTLTDRIASALNSKK